MERLNQHSVETPLATSPEAEPKEPDLKNVQGAIGKITLSNLDTSANHSLTDAQREEIAEKHRQEERDHAIEDVRYHAGEIRSIEQDFATYLHKKQGKVSEQEFEKWEDAFTDEWQKIEKITNDQNLNIRQQAEGKQYIRTYFKEEELHQTIEAYAGNFYRNRNFTLRNLIANSDNPRKDDDLEQLRSFVDDVSRHLDFKYPLTNEATLKMDLDRFKNLRTKVHNEVITHLNDLNALAKRYGSRPFTVRDFWTSRVEEKNQTPAMSSLMRYDRDIVEEYYYQAFTSEEDKRKAITERFNAHGIYR